MDATRAKTLRRFVGVSLLLGGLALLAGTIGLQNATAEGGLPFGLVAISVIVMLLIVVFEEQRPWPWFAPALLPVLLLMLGILWARYDPAGHLFLSGLAPFVAFLTGYGILERRPWSWPVAFVSVAGVGPTILLFAPLDAVTIGGAFALFLVDALFLLALAPSYFEPAPPRA